jgi:hypothetical protein
VTTHTTTGLKANWKQFTLLVIINAFVGGMVGMERTLLPEIAQQNVQCYAFLYCGIRNRESHFKLFCRQSCQSSAEIALAFVEKCKKMLMYTKEIFFNCIFLMPYHGG